jgi:adenine specific DNA methylase Mod
MYLKVTLKTPENFNKEIMEVLVSCLIFDERCFNVWKSLYLKNLFMTSIFLKHVGMYFVYQILLLYIS